ncbi:MAG: hypothetical protein ACRDOB_09980 [Streptosporangiaceae bacterium]
MLLLLGGLLVKHAEANEVALCSSGFGRFGQALDPNVANSCSLAQELSNGATVAIWIGAIVLAIAVVGLIAALIGAGAMASSRNAKAARPPARASAPPARLVQASTTPARLAQASTTGAQASTPLVQASARPALSSGPRAAAGNAASFPAVAWDPPRNSAAPARPQPALVHPGLARPSAATPQQVQVPGNGCGHEARPGARFCAVCGCQVTDGRPVPVLSAPAHPGPPTVTTNGRHGRAPDAQAWNPHQAGPGVTASAGRPGRHRVAP